MDLTVVRFPLELLGVGVLVLGVITLIVWAVLVRQALVRYTRLTARRWTGIAVVVVSLGLIVTGFIQSYVMSRDVLASEMSWVYGVSVNERTANMLSSDLTRDWFTHREAVFNNPPVGDIEYGSAAVLIDGDRGNVYLAYLDGEWVIATDTYEDGFKELPRVN